MKDQGLGVTSPAAPVDGAGVAAKPSKVARRPRMSEADLDLIERLRVATYTDARGYKDYSFKPDEDARRAAKLIMRLSGRKYGPPKFVDLAKAQS